MASDTNSNIDEDLALALRLSQLSSDAFDQCVSQLRPEQSASAGSTPCPPTPRSDREHDMAMVSDISQRSLHDSEEQFSRLHSSESAPAAYQTGPPDEYDEDDLELVLRLSELLADIFDEQVGELNGQRESRGTDDNNVASLLAAMSFLEVWMALPPYLS